MDTAYWIFRYFSYVCAWVDPLQFPLCVVHQLRRRHQWNFNDGLCCGVWYLFKTIWEHLEYKIYLITSSCCCYLAFQLGSRKTRQRGPTYKGRQELAKSMSQVFKKQMLKLKIIAYHPSLGSVDLIQRNKTDVYLCLKRKIKTRNAAEMTYSIQSIACCAELARGRLATSGAQSYPYLWPLQKPHNSPQTPKIHSTIA